MDDIAETSAAPSMTKSFSAFVVGYSPTKSIIGKARSECKFQHVTANEGVRVQRLIPARQIIDR